MKFHESIGGLSLTPVLENHSAVMICLEPFGLKLSFPSTHSGTLLRKGEEDYGVDKPTVWKMSSWLQKQHQGLYTSHG